jgi:hypothetical protein
MPSFSVDVTSARSTNRNLMAKRFRLLVALDALFESPAGQDVVPPAAPPL